MIYLVKSQARQQSRGAERFVGWTDQLPSIDFVVIRQGVIRIFLNLFLLFIHIYELNQDLHQQFLLN